MQSTSTNGVQTSAHEALDSLRQVIDRLEAELKRQQQEIQELRAERSDVRKMLVDQIRHLLEDPKEWENLDEKDFTGTTADLLADLRSM